MLLAKKSWSHGSKKTKGTFHCARIQQTWSFGYWKITTIYQCGSLAQNYREFFEHYYTLNTLATADQKET
jgi:hypothetical protein